MSALEAPAAFFQKPLPAKSPAQQLQDREHAAGTVREVIEIDRAGRRISRFYGDPEAVWAPFKQVPRRVTGWNTKL